MWVRDRLDGLWGDEDFAGWYPRDGRPGISPAQLATVSVLEFLLDLSDRDAAEAVRCRIDFKYALGLDLDDPGFHHSVLGDFRDRLLEEGRADRLLNLALARLKEAGLVRERTAQRTDSTHVRRHGGPGHDSGMGPLPHQPGPGRDPRSGGLARRPEGAGILSIRQAARPTRGSLTHSGNWLASMAHGTWTRPCGSSSTPGSQVSFPNSASDSVATGHAAISRPFRCRRRQAGGPRSADSPTCHFCL